MKPDTSFPVRLGAVVALLFFGVLGGWAAWAPLATAAMAVGEVVVESNRKTVQHLEGGIVAEILVRDGDRVEEGQVLVRLDTTQAESALAQHAAQLDSQRALAARLVSERDGAQAVSFPADLVSRAISEADLRLILDGQRSIFAARRIMMEGQRDILTQRIGQLQAQIAGARAQIDSLGRQRMLIRSESSDASHLLERGLMQRSRVLALQREAASLDGRLGEMTSSVAALEQAIGETRLAIASLDDTRADEVARELRDAESLIAELEQKVRANSDILKRQDVTAPVAGLVVDLKIFTAGGVIQPGQDLMDIVPARDALWVTARVSPTDIDVVRPGQPAQVMLLAFSQRSLPPLTGRLVTVSADRLLDETTGDPYFSARIDLDDTSGLALSPGMPVQAMIVTGEQTLLAYLAAPLTASLTRAMKED